MRPRFALVTVFVLAVVVAACGSGPAASSAGGGGGGGGAAASAGGGGGAGNGTTNAKSYDLCTLLTQAEVSAATGGPMGAGVPQNDGQMCLWDGDSGEVSISVGGTAFSDICVAGTPSVSGIGDAACWLEGGKLATLLEFSKGGQPWEIAVVQPNGTVDSIKSAEKTLALAALGRM